MQTTFGCSVPVTCAMDNKVEFYSNSIRFLDSQGQHGVANNMAEETAQNNSVENTGAKPNSGNFHSML